MPQWVLVGMVFAGCEVSDPRPMPVALDDAEPQLQRALCERVFSSACRCDQWSVFESESECNAEVSGSIADLRGVLQGASGPRLTYDAACMGEFVGLIDEIGCDTDYEAETECQPPCLLAYGTIPEGRPCEIYDPLFSDCAQGLLCQGTCTDPCKGPIGAAAQGESCEDRVCAVGLVCNEALRCEPLPNVGEPCPFGTCEGEAFCEPSPDDPAGELRCFAPRSLGQPCRGHQQCSNGHCPAGFCEALPRLSEPCFGICDSGLDCIDNTCVPGDALLCTALPLP